MRAWRALHKSLAWKIFFTYLMVLIIGGIALMMTAELHMPVALERHLAAMAVQMGDAGALRDDLFSNSRRALIESGLFAIAVATVVATGLSVYISRRVVAPIHDMLHVTERIADGHYDERIELLEHREIARDLDELEQLAVSFNRMAATLERTETMRQELIGNVAHELRTPLTSIKGYMEGLVDGVLPPTATTFEKVHREADRLQRLVHDLQELSRLEEHAIDLDLRPLSVLALVETTLDRLRPQFEEKGIALRVDLAQDLPLILGDEDRLGQVMLNIVGNALHYTPKGRQVTIDATQAGDQVRIVVMDEGIGVAPEHLAHLFDRFYRVDRSRSRAGGGSGIGLTISRHLVEAHGGNIWASSGGLARGSTFSFTIPIAKHS